MNEVELFEKEKLHGKCSIEEFEEKYLKNQEASGNEEA